MADGILQGSDWSVAGNWSGAALPGNNEHAYIPGTLDADVTSGLDQTGDDLDLIRVHEDFEKNLGATGSPLKIAADELKHYGKGGLYYSCAANSAGLKTDFVQIQCAHNRAITELNSVSGDAGDYTTMLFERGTIRILGDLTWDASGLVVVGYVNTPATDVRLNIAAGSDTLAELRQTAGDVISHRAITTAYCQQGTLRQETAAITTLHIFSGGHVTYNHTSGPTTCYVHAGGTLDLLGNTQDKAITTLWAFPGSTVLYDEDTNLHNITTFHDYRRPRP